MVRAIVGANWGDEGKGKITDMLAESSDIVVRFQGGANAGHTIINNYGRFSLHLLPSGVFYDHTTSVLGNGVALDIEKFIAELKSLVDAGVPTPKILVSDRAQVMMPYHVLFDTLEEARLAGKSYGSTKSGIAPFFSDKFAKIGLQVNELFDEEVLTDRLHKVVEMKNATLRELYHAPELVYEELLAEMHKQRDLIAPYVTDTSKFLREALKAGKTVLLEGQLGTMKDPDHGIYPMVTSSSTLAAYGAVGAGIPPYEIKDIIAVTKAYSSAVGAGDFVSELFGDEAEELRKRGGDKGEYGATTGRPRRVGWYDAVASKYGCQLQSATEAVLTVLDVLGYLKELKVCTGYEIDGKVTTDFPVTPLLHKAKPVYETLPGWNCDIRGITDYEDLPKECKDYIDFIEKQIETPITMVSNGPERHAILKRTPKI
ncbi:MAG: adenylosuccinate synthase [Oribacterium sp.]|nr:adenylosuccinate synthase [Oribacterium sp.]